MKSLVVAMKIILLNTVSQVRFTKDEHPAHPLRFYTPDKPLNSQHQIRSRRKRQFKLSCSAVGYRKLAILLPYASRELA